ncbi:MAG: uncharacterized protein A8A55_2449 [Amphiamblys sp. WSBS2006]|nr:MAG: uncharacterized protein A8A55_2449 [Amphiamblys sp. WSBS2006]
MVLFDVIRDAAGMIPYTIKYFIKENKPELEGLGIGNNEEISEKINALRDKKDSYLEEQKIMFEDSWRDFFSKSIYAQFVEMVFLHEAKTNKKIPVFERSEGVLIKKSLAIVDVFYFDNSEILGYLQKIKQPRVIGCMFHPRASRPVLSARGMLRGCTI